MEAELPERSWYERLAGADSGTLLQRIGEYYHSFQEIDSIYRYADALEQEKARYLQLISKLIADESVNRFLRAEYDFDNLFLLWKSKFMEAGVEEEVYSECGLTAFDILWDAVENGSGVFLPRYLKEPFDILDSDMERSGLDTAQHAVERSKWDFLLRAAPSEFAREYTRMRIDIFNIRTFIRLKRSALLDSEQERWIPGGRIDILTFRTLFSEAEDGLHSYLKYSHYSALAGAGLDSGTDLWRVEPILTGELYRHLRESRHSFFDIEPVIYHLENMERNYTALRGLIAGSINRLPEEVTMEILEGTLPS
jgi:vacuolar-type H+-ATPase subunit C/Vma6